MSEDSSTPEFPALEADAVEKAPRKKRAATKSPAKSPTKSAAKPADQVEEQPKESEGKPSADAVASDSPAAESSPRPIKRGVRVVKNASSKKTSAKKGSNNATSQESNSTSEQTQERKSDAPAQDGSDASASEESHKSQPQQQQQQRQGRGRGRNRGRQQGQGEQQQEAPNAKIDTKTVAARAWKIFVGEVNEEGLALIADKDARELARRSLRIAEIYTREEAVLLQKGKTATKTGKAEPKASEEFKAESQD